MYHNENNETENDMVNDGDACGSGCGCGSEASCGDDCDEHEHGDVEVNFFNYVASMGYQSMIFLGEVANPVTGEQECNLRQAKFLIDTIALLRDKTKGNLTPQEEQFLNGTYTELQMKYDDMQKQEGSSDSNIIIN
jgi:hypothetical protein